MFLLTSCNNASNTINQSISRKNTILSAKESLEAERFLKLKLHLVNYSGITVETAQKSMLATHFCEIMVTTETASGGRRSVAFRD